MKIGKDKEKLNGLQRYCYILQRYCFMLQNKKISKSKFIPGVSVKFTAAKMKQRGHIPPGSQPDRGTQKL